MLLDAIGELDIDPRRSWMIGDSDSDVEAAAAAGVRSMLVEYPSSAHRRHGIATPDVTVADLGEAAAFAVEARGYDGRDA
jgi:phosphoglycolate phosphatase-like HAD superfamily hydrolase